MRAYRVVLMDNHQGSSFEFAVTVRGENDLHAMAKAYIEFPECVIISATRLPGKRI